MDLDFTDLSSRLAGTPLQPLTPLLQPEFVDRIVHGDFRRWRQLLRQLPEYRAQAVNLGEVVTFSEPQRTSTPETATLHATTPPPSPASALNESPGLAPLTATETAQLRARLQAFIPWRKGPFRVFDIHIDSEWQCQLKWQRLVNKIQPLRGRTVLDVGCGNGYFGFRMLEQGAQLVLGLEPHPPYAAQFWAIKHFCPQLPLSVLPAALEQLPAKLAAFHTVFSMGVLYHCPSPIDHLKRCHDCPQPGGELVLETLYVDGAEDYSLTPTARYARMKNVWFVPGIKTLEHWLDRCGFCDIKVLAQSVTTTDEQRPTAWMPFASLAAALAPDDPTRTIEGLPAPQRVVLSAVRE